MKLRVWVWSVALLNFCPIHHVGEGMRDILPSAQHRHGPARLRPPLQFWVPVFHSIMCGRGYGEMPPSRFSPADAHFGLVRASPGWKRCDLTSLGLYNWCRSQPVCTQLWARGNFEAEQQNIRGCWEEHLGLWIPLVSTEFIFKTLDFRASALSEPAAICVPFLHLAFSLCASLSKVGEEHSFRGGATMEKCWFTPRHGNGSHKGTTENNEGYFVGGFIFYQTFFNIISSPSGRQK